MSAELPAEQVGEQPSVADMQAEIAELRRWLSCCISNMGGTAIVRCYFRTVPIEIERTEHIVILRVEN